MIFFVSIYLLGFILKKTLDKKNVWDNKYFFIKHVKNNMGFEGLTAYFFSLNLSVLDKKTLFK